MMRRFRELILVLTALLLSAALVRVGRPSRALAVALAGAAGVALLVWLERRERRWPRLVRHVRFAQQVSDDRLWPLLDAAEDALAAVAIEGRELGRALEPVARGVIDLARRALALGRIRAGHERTLARISLEPVATRLELDSRAEVARLDAELESLKRTLATIGPSVRHLRLLAQTGEADVHAGEPAHEVEAHLETLRHALAEEMAS
jgi:hypothetical protein